MSITKDQILDAITNMSMVEIVELITMIEKKFSISTTPVVPNVVNHPTQPAEEKVAFKVLLTTIGPNKIAVIKFIRNAMHLGLKEAKDLVESAPVTLKENTNQDDANKFKKLLEEVGATIEIH